MKQELEVGTPCVWYPHAETNQQPMAGIVTEVKQPGVLILYIFPKGGGSPLQKTNVHHVDEEYLVTNPKMGLLYGGWDTCEAAAKRRTDELATKKARSIQSDNERRNYNRREQEESRVQILSERGFGVEEIAKKVEWDVEEVQKIVVRYKEEQTA